MRKVLRPSIGRGRIEEMGGDDLRVDRASEPGPSQENEPSGEKLGSFSGRAMEEVLENLDLPSTNDRDGQTPWRSLDRPVLRGGSNPEIERVRMEDDKGPDVPFGQGIATGAADAEHRAPWAVDPLVGRMARSG